MEEINWENVDVILNNVIDEFMKTMKKHKEDDSFNIEENYDILKMIIKRMEKIVIERSTRE